MSATANLSVRELRAAGRHPELPFRLDLGAQGSLEFHRLLRLLPSRRLSGAAIWNGRPVFAKLFVDRAARRYGERERDGLAALQAKGLPTPELLAAFPLGEDGYLVLSEFIVSARALDDDLPTPEEPAAMLAAFALLGRLHAAGLVHEDLHLGNFLYHGGGLCLIDGDGVRPAAGGRLDENLALLLSQLPPAWSSLRAELLEAYGRSVDIRRLEPAVVAVRERRLRHFLDKTLRNCTQFAVHKDSQRFAVVLREQEEALAAILVDPDAALAAGELCKAGGTATVGRAEAGGRPLVIKRYNLKHWRHALSRAWRPSRAWHSWLAAHRLIFCGIATPRPLALVEERFGPLRGRAFLLTEYCGGKNLLETLAPDSEPPPVQKQALAGLFEALCVMRITHGDLKATNLLWDDGSVVLIDLDAMVRHRTESGFRRAWRRDRARLLRNWPAGSVLQRWLDAALPPA